MKKTLFILLTILFLQGTTYGAFNFIDNNDGTVTDGRTGLVWLKNASPGARSWEGVKSSCANLASGQAGLTDGSTAGQWRLPTKTELQRIGTDPPKSWESGFPSVTWTMPGAPFVNVQPSDYWSGTGYPGDTLLVWLVHLGVGFVDTGHRQGGHWYWPVRGYVQVTTTTTAMPVTTTTTLPPISTTSTVIITSTTTTPPTLIELENFTANAENKKITLEWSTESEIDNAGFNIYRSDSKEGEYIKINDELIPAQGSATEGVTYDFVDEGLQNRKEYFYKLEDIDLNGTATIHGAVSATPLFLYGIFNK